MKQKSNLFPLIGMILLGSLLVDNSKEKQLETAMQEPQILVADNSCTFITKGVEEPSPCFK